MSGTNNKIAEQGHELATHVHSHRLDCDLTPAEFKEELITSKCYLKTFPVSRHAYADLLHSQYRII